MHTPPKYSRLDPGKRREQILDAANALFAERGYDEVSVEDIASSAGVARGLVHHYFGGRKEVYIALLERLGTMREQDLPPPVGRSARARLADDVSRWLDWTEQNRTIWLGTIAHGEDIADPDVRRVVTHLVRRAVALVAARHAEIAADSPRLRYALERWTALNRAATRRWLTRRGHPRGDPRVARLDARARPTHLRHSTQAKPAHSSSLRANDRNARKQHSSGRCGRLRRPDGGPLDTAASARGQGRTPRGWGRGTRRDAVVGRGDTARRERRGLSALPQRFHSTIPRHVVRR